MAILLATRPRQLLLLRGLTAMMVVCWCLGFSSLGEGSAQAQERIYGAAVPYSESYPRGERIDAQYEEYLSQAGPYAFGYPWTYGFPFGYRVSPWGPRYLPGGLNSYLGPRYAPYAGLPSPYYTWPYEWSYGLVRDPDVAPLGWGLLEPAEELPPFAPVLPGPRRLFW